MKTKLLLIFGGESSEHDVSIASARNVCRALDRERYELSLCYISNDGNAWSLVPSFDELSGPELIPLLGRKAFKVNDDTLQIDVLMPILHGKHGEDGELQALGSLLHIPYVGPSLIGAAVTMDKDLTKHLLHDEGVPVVEWHTWHTSDAIPEYDQLRKTLGDVLFVKPSNAGSSIGVSKATNAAELAAALTLAASHDSIVLIERAINGREIELGVLGNAAVSVTAPGEIIPGDEYYSYDAKYASASASHDEIPAKLDKQTIATLKDLALKAYRIVRGHGMARVDFFVTKEGDIYLNEINSIPGFTNISMYPKMWQHEGVSYSSLIDRLIELSLES